MDSGSRVRIEEGGEASPAAAGVGSRAEGRTTNSRGSDVNTVTSADANSSELADNITGRVADDVVALACATPPSTAPDLASLKAENERLRAQLQDAPDTASLEAENERLRAQLQDAPDTASFEAENERLRAQLQDAQQELRASKDAEAKARGEGDAARSELERLMQEQGSLAEKLSRETELEDENSDLRLRVSSLEEELTVSKDVLSAKPTVELPSEPPEDNAVLTEAYKKISELNTQLARLYAELTLARAEAQHLRGSAAAAAGGAPPADDGAQAAAEAKAAEGQKHSQQIADLVSDIRHLQLDLEYHQQKLDQMIREKQQLLVENRKLQADLADAKQSLEEQDQMLKHREVDLEHLREEAKLLASAPPGGGSACDSETLAALRSEAASKDSALIVSHYELHKEKLVRDRLEQKNVKLMERMQKLMMVVESMRKENAGLEKTLKAKEQQLEESDAKAREASRRAKQAQGRAAKSSSKKVLDGSVEFEAPSQHELPRLDSARRRQIDAAGSRSGVSTPRSTRGAPQSPYTTR